MNKGDWMNIVSVEELKEWGTLKEVKALLKESWKEDQLISGNSFEQLFKKVKAIQDVVNQQAELESKGYEAMVNPETYFASEASEYLFYLLELDGELRIKKLGIHRGLFSNKKQAKTWYRNIAHVIHPDHCQHPKANQGMNVLNELYQSMINY